MEIRELRIGNLVTYSIEALPVACIYKDSVSFAPIRESPWRTTPIELIKPIPLTEEWLWKFRFTKDRYNDYSIMINTPDKQLAFTSLEDGSFFPTINEMGELSHEPCQCVHLNKITSVHQLMNLYFALCGEELTIKKAVNL